MYYECEDEPKKIDQVNLITFFKQYLNEYV